MMKRLLFMLAFLVSFGLAAVGQESVDPNEEESQEQTSEENQNPSTVDGITTVTLDGSQSLADLLLLVDQPNSISYLKLVGQLTAEDFETMKAMPNLKLIDMADIISLPTTTNGEAWIPDNIFGSIGTTDSYAKLSLCRVIFPPCVEVIGSGAFAGCVNLFEVDFSHATNLKIINANAFSSCSKISSVDLSACNTLETLGSKAFSNCNSLKQIDLSNTRIQTITQEFIQCTQIEQINLSNCGQLEEIGDEAFDSNANLSIVNLSGCSKLKRIGDFAFHKSSLNVDQLTFDFSQLTNLQQIGQCAFRGTSLRDQITFNSNIKEIGNEAFENCQNITSISFNQNSDLSTINALTFNNCTNLTTIDFTRCSNLNAIEKDAFNNCAKLQNIIIDSQNTTYTSIDGALIKLKQDGATYNSLLLYPAGKNDREYTIPSAVEVIVSDAFPYNQYLRKLTIPSSVLGIENNAFGVRINDFHSQMPLTVYMQSETPIGLQGTVGFENSTIIVPKGSFQKYKTAGIWQDYLIYEEGNESVSIELDGSMSLANAFKANGYDASLIKNLTIKGPLSRSDIRYMRVMYNLMTLDLSEADIENKTLPSSSFERCSTKVEKIVLPIDLKYIEDNAFYYQTYLKEINLSELNSLQSIGAFAFYKCPNLPTTLALPTNLESIGNNAFAFTGINTINLENTHLTTIGSSAFENCSLTGSIVFPTTLERIEAGAFGSAKFTSIQLQSSDVVLEENNFMDKGNCTLTVPLDSKYYYMSASNWRDFPQIIEENAPSGDILTIVLTEMGTLEDYLIKHEDIDVNNVTELTISGPMDWRDIKQIFKMQHIQKLNMLDVQMENNEIPIDAFTYDGTGTALPYLTEVILPKELESIKSGAFLGAYRLKRVVLPSTLKNLEGFSDCNMLSDINISTCTSLEYIGGFSFCQSLPSSLVLPPSIKGIGSFSNSSITFIDLSQTSVPSIQWKAFQNCRLTGDWEFPGTLTFIDATAFDAAEFTSIKLRSLEMVKLSGINAFPSVDLNNFKIYVPHNLVEVYKNDKYWYQYSNNIEGYGDAIINVNTNNTDWGTVTGSGAYEEGEKITLNILDDYRQWQDWGRIHLLVGWFEGDTKISNEIPYCFTSDGQDHDYLAKLEQICFSNHGGISIVNKNTQSITVSIDLTRYDTESIFIGWYEDGICLSTEQTLTVQAKDGTKSRFIEPRFSYGYMMYDNEIINDISKKDGFDVLLFNNVKIEGEKIWIPKSLSLYRNKSSVVIESPIETSSIHCGLFDGADCINGWLFIYLPYNIKVNEIRSDQFVIRYYDGEARAKNGAGNSWKQLAPNETMKPNRGYIMRISEPVTNASFNTDVSEMQALLTNRSVSIPLPKHESVAAPDANWNLIGNPYPCYYNIGSLYENGFKGTITVWDPQLDNYQYYTQDDADQYLKPLTAFFVQQTDEVSSILFTTSGRAAKLPEGTTRSASALRSGDGRQVLNLVLSNDSLSDKTRIVFNEAAKAGYELGLDASKFRSMNPNAPAFYSIDADNQQLAINERPWDNGVVRLGCNFGVKGEYSIALQEAVEQDLILVDKVTGALTNLKEQAYRFSAEVGESNDRFELRSGNPTGMEEMAGFQWQVRGGQLFLTGLPTNAQVIVHDTMGRTVCDRTVSDELSGLALPQAGVYYLTIRTQQATRTERIMVKE